MSLCPSDEQIDNLAAGALSETDAAPLRAHVEQCPSCREVFDECQANLAFAPKVLGAAWNLDARSSGTLKQTGTRGQGSGIRSRGSGVSGRSLGKPLTPDPRPLTPTDSIPGYRIIREIHRGGQGVVYEAVQLSTKRIVAVKVLLEGPFAGERAKWRFENEVKLIAALKHPNIVIIHDSGITHGKYYFAMDYVQGSPLDQFAERIQAQPTRESITPSQFSRDPKGSASHSSGRVPLLSSSGGRGALLESSGTQTQINSSARGRTNQLIALFVRICEAVGYAHRRGVIHRDLKPSNILVSDDGTPYVLDFGLAKATGDKGQESAADMASITGHLMGTLRFMSPEQTTGEPDAIDVRTDVYSLGIILYELLTGKPPYETGRKDITTALRNIRETDPPQPSKCDRHINSELSAIVMKAVAKEPERRYQSADELARDLSAWLQGLPVTAKSASSLYVLRKLAFRHSFQTLIVATVLLIVVGFAGLYYELYQSEIGRDNLISRLYKQLTAANIRTQSMVPIAQANVHRQAMGWFLLAWEANRIDEARDIQQQLPASSPESTAAAFLLNDNASADKIREAVPAKQLAEFAIGERALKHGRTQEAIVAFEASLQSGSDAWLKARTQARLNQLRPSTAPAQPGS